ncbi:15-hydroxyprostaglandin dehydrogenase [NAD(+)]-like [Anabas testudineus]|uniref:15-hydroxyprostaglandin dehydrogenase [NAD(+)] n=1 Tax=Anabas testudineus TaxID=64144 RepID=A0A3Q1IFU7_ANATE|nr:15-hydroxyprostaglandin dehydrogenase [NAD(+)]-like [Anabas testudineus]
MALNGKVAVVTGAAMGIGKAIAETLLHNGAKVVLLDVNEPVAKSVMKDLNKQYGQDRTLFLRCDVTSDEHIKAAFQKTIETFGGIDIVCNNAGTLDENDWEKTVSINLLGVIRGTYTAMEHMNKLTGGRGGVIINTASIAGIFPVESFPVYTATKHGVVGFTRAMAAASTASGYGIRFNAICPGPVQTQLISISTSRMGQFSHLGEKLVSKYKEAAMILTPSEVAEFILELVTDETKNGEALMILQKENKYITFPSM